MGEDPAISFHAIFGKSRPAAECDLKAFFGFVVRDGRGFRPAFHWEERLPDLLKKDSAKIDQRTELRRQFTPDHLKCQMPRTPVNKKRTMT